ncbi:integral membrane sensor signal transduction histidine kinase [Clostridium sp. CAG:1013]|nr:integral membrane sensor signal transduction histidine kinase [Clostridium sp. CAG:1013]
MFKKLRKKFIVLNMTMISVTVIFAFLAIYLITQNNIESQNSLKLENASSFALRQIDNSEDNYSQILVTDTSSEYYFPFFNALIDENNQPMISQSVSNETKSATLKLTELALNSDSNKLEFNNRKYQFSIESAFAQVSVESNVNGSNPEVYRMITFIDITDSINTLNQLLLTFVIIGVFMLGAIFLISVFFARKSVAPIESSYSRQKQFIADASHELKTPVASIGANIEAIESNPDDPVYRQKKWIDYIKIELERMNKLISDLLSLAKYDNLQTTFNMTAVNLSDIVNDSLLTMEAFAFEKGIEICSDIKEDVIAVVDGEKYEQVIKILFDNAVKYVNESGKIDITLKENKNHAIFEISNTGDGIAPEHLNKIFDRFYRIDSSRENNGSYGLGLSIAKTIVEHMNGKIAVSSALGQITTFTVTINK